VSDNHTLFLFPGASRINRLDGINTGEVPKEFYYGYLYLKEQGYSAEVADTHDCKKSIINKMLLNYEIKRNSFLNFGISKQRVIALENKINNAETAISFTDGFSLSMGLYHKKYKKETILIGGFHGLSDILKFVKPGIRKYADYKIRKALNKLDHIFFFGDADQKQAIEYFNIKKDKTSLFKFGVDTDFWAPPNTNIDKNYILSVGSDRNRDYDTLTSTSISIPIKILTRLPISFSPSKDIELIKGNYFDSPITDTVLRNMYQKSSMVVVPVHDVYQPSGYSVTLQAMSCGKVVILSNFKGLWDRDIFISNKNCILVSPNNTMELQKAINKIHSDHKLRKKIENSARETAIKNFSLHRMNDGIRKIIDRKKISNN